MLVLHGSWLPSEGKRDGRFAFWAEDADRLRPRPRRLHEVEAPRLPRRHPFAASAQRTLAALSPLLGASERADAEERTAFARLPSSARAPLPSPDLASAEQGTVDSQATLSAWRIDVLACTPVRALRALVELGAADVSPTVAVGDDLRYWTVAARLALGLLYRQRFLPALAREGFQYVARWQPLLEPTGEPGEGSDRQMIDVLARAMPPVCRALAWQIESPEPRPGELLRDFLAAAVDGVARESLPFGRLPSRTQRSRGEVWFGGLQEAAVYSPEVAHRVVADLYGEYRAWAEPAAQSTAAETFRLCFRLSAPAAEDLPASGPAPGQLPWTLEYLLQATDDPSLLVPAGEVWRRGAATARFLNRRLDNPQEHLLAGLGRAAGLFAPVEASLHAPCPSGCLLTADEAYAFVREKALLLRAAGCGVLVPNLETRLGVRVRLKGKSKEQGLGLLGWDRVIEYDWQVMLGDQELSRAEFEALARLKQPLIQLRGQWIELRPEQVDKALAFFDRRAAGDTMSLTEALGVALAPDGQQGLPVVDVVAEDWLAGLLARLGEGGTREELAEPGGFVGCLRPYQRLGLSWLATLRGFGLGACLADDMGLGKTIQIIALLLHARREEPTTPALLICPTSVVGNWRHELKRFAPSLRVLVHHGAEREREDFAACAAAHDVIISTYALLHRDEEALASVQWSAVVLDEAQNIKNPATKAAQAARRLSTAWRAALTGTPVENRLADLWSIFHFLNPGYLGSGEEFRKRFAEPIERLHDAGTTARLKKLVSPFVLRRLKTDRAVIADLPEKNEMKVYCNLTKEQATLYEAVVRDSLEQIEAAEGIRRRGVVLATLAKLKQVCDHPALFLKDKSDPSGRSGKLARLVEMLEEVLAVDEAALVFTQYAEMGKLLVAHLGESFSREVLFLHGGTPAPERDRMVARFQTEARGPRLFVLSLKAGGTGLNLTRANHVFHFDRWWNPAVENQATDRAFRIGQQRSVAVHKFVCAGTFEEAIDDLIERKQKLAQAIVGTSEAWLTELSTRELRELFALRAEAVGED